MDKNADWRYKLQIISSALITIGAVSFGAGFTIYTLNINPDPNLFFSKGIGAMMAGIMIFIIGIIVPLKLRNKK